MKTITLIFISVIALASSHFLRELDAAALTVTATTFPKTCVSSFTGTTLEADFTGTAAATATGYTTTATIKKDAQTTVGYTCTALTATSKKLECSYSTGDSTATDGEYKLDTVVEAKDGESTPGNAFTVGSTAKTAVIKKNANYLPLKSYTASSQTIDYKKDEPHFFTLTYSANIGTASKPSKVKAGTKEFTACTATEAVLNCTVTKETLPVGNYTVTVVNACELDEDTKVSLVVVEDVSSILSFSKYLVLVLGLFLF